MAASALNARRARAAADPYAAASILCWVRLRTHRYVCWNGLYSVKLWDVQQNPGGHLSSGGCNFHSRSSRATLLSHRLSGPLPSHRFLSISTSRAGRDLWCAALGEELVVAYSSAFCILPKAAGLWL